MKRRSKTGKSVERVLCIPVDMKIYKELSKLAKKDNLSITKTIRQLITNTLDVHREITKIFNKHKKKTKK